MIQWDVLAVAALSFFIFTTSLHGQESDTEYYPNRPGRTGHKKLPPGLNGGGPPGLNGGGPPGLNHGEPFSHLSVTAYNSYVESERSCRSNEFRCNSGACLSSELKCNKVTDCDDGSDEADCSRPSCSTSGCILPPQPRGGKYEKYLSKDNCTRKDENKVPINSILVYYCHDGHVLRGYASSTCINNNWTELPTCVGICPPLESTTVDISCTYEEKSVSCSQQVKPGTRAKLSCKQSHKLPLNSDPVYREIVCLEDATWNHLLYECIATCGQVQHYTSHTVFPWYVGVYERKSKNNIQHVCGGSLISSNLVISAAHCFYNEVFSEVQDPSRYNVTAGKYHRNWEVEETYAQTRSVERIIVTDSYIGNIGHHLGDIAILKLVTPFELTFFIRPVCVDWDNSLEKKQLTNGQVGKVTGWGEQKDGMYNKNLREFNVPYISFNQCSMNASIESITLDKFCAGGLNGSSLCFGHSGSGLFFETDGIWYIRGIVSVSTRQQEYCDSNSYVGFTYVSHYREWIKSIFELQ